MLSILIILCFSVLYAHDEMGGALVGEMFTPWEAVIASVSPLAVLVGLLGLVLPLLERKLDRTGEVRFAMLGERLVAWSRLAAVGVYLTSVLAIGLLGAVRKIIGDLIFIDEMLTMLPLLLTLLAGWWAAYPIERRMREAVILRRVESGRPVYPLPGRWRYVWASFRTQVLYVFLPLAGMLAWTEASLRGIAALPDSWREDWREPALVTGSHVLGVVGILLSMPAALRYVWDTIVLGDSPLTRRLIAVCEQYGVRVRRLLMWRTDGVIVNGAVVGVLRPFRYILLTDALLDQLPTGQIEAVMAHEVAHVKCRHVVWLGVSVIASVFAGSVGADWLVRHATNMDPDSSGAGTLALGLTLATIFLGFGAASRVFERQADAFAARHMSKATQPAETPAPEQGPAFTDTGVAFISDALENVALLNGISPERFAWRHGSIAQRVRHLRTLPGLALGRVAADRAARRVKLISLAVLAISVLVMFLTEPVR